MLDMLAIYLAILSSIKAHNLKTNLLNKTRL